MIEVIVKMKKKLGVRGVRSGETVGGSGGCVGRIEVSIVKCT